MKCYIVIEERTRNVTFVTEERTRDVTLSSRKEQGMLHCHRGKNKECYMIIVEITRNATLSLRK